MSRGYTDPLPVAPIPVTAPSGPRDSSSNALQRPTNAHNSVPSGPRQTSHSTARDISHPEHSRSSRLPPSGPSFTSVSKIRGKNESIDYPNESPALRDRDIMEVDNIPPSRTSSFRTNETTIRAGSGMYADREQSSDLPRGPRAMSGKSSAPTPYPPTGRPRSSSPPPYADRNVPVQEHSNRFRDRSPPPHMVNRERWETYGDSGNAIAKEGERVWKPASRENDPPVWQKSAHEVERGHVRWLSSIQL
jgi:hypothetical protein